MKGKILFSSVLYIKFWWKTAPNIIIFMTLLLTVNFLSKTVPYILVYWGQNVSNIIFLVAQCFLYFNFNGNMLLEQFCNIWIAWKNAKYLESTFNEWFPSLNCIGCLCTRHYFKFTSQLGKGKMIKKKKKIHAIKYEQETITLNQICFFFFFLFRSNDLAQG